jgi:hypothetical protein
MLAKAPARGGGDFRLARSYCATKKDRPCGDFPYRAGGIEPDPSLILDLDYWFDAKA